MSSIRTLFKYTLNPSAEVGSTKLANRRVAFAGFVEDTTASVCAHFSPVHHCPFQIFSIYTNIHGWGIPEKNRQNDQCINTGVDKFTNQQKVGFARRCLLWWHLIWFEAEHQQHSTHDLMPPRKQKLATF